MTGRGFDLEERTLAFAKRVIHLCKSVGQHTINRELISQLIRASGSIGANYREANDALSKKDFVHRIKITRREAKEAHYWLQLFEAANPEADGEIQALSREAVELKKIFSAIADKSS
jgi:four helix bundle protein